MSLPISGHPQRVDRIHLVAGRKQRLHPRPPLGLDPDHDLNRLIVVADVLADQRVQPGNPGDPFRQAGLTQPATGLVLHLHIVVILSPIVSDQQ